MGGPETIKVLCIQAGGGGHYQDVPKEKVVEGNINYMQLAILSGSTPQCLNS